MPFQPIKCLLSILFVFLFAVFMSGSLFAGEDEKTKTIEVIGTAKVFNKNISSAGERAIFNSLAAAVELASRDIIPLDTRVSNFKTLNKTLYNHANDFIINYKVLATCLSGETYRVIVQTTISTENIKDRLSSLGIVPEKKPLPGVLLLIAEQQIGANRPQYWWSGNHALKEDAGEKSIAGSMRSHGFHIIDHFTFVPAAHGKAGVYNPDLNDMEAVALGIRLKADVVVAGTAIAAQTTNIMGSSLRSFKGHVKARALRTDTMEIIATTSKTAVVVNRNALEGGRDALSDAGRLTGEDLADMIISAWQKDNKAISAIKILVEGTDNFSNFVMFRRTLNAISGVTDVRTVEMESGEATIVLNFQGDAKELAGFLMLKIFAMFGLNIDEVSENYMRVNLVSGQTVTKIKK